MTKEKTFKTSHAKNKEYRVHVYILHLQIEALHQTFSSSSKDNKF